MTIDEGENTVSRARLVDYHLERLKDAQPTVRLDAIKELLLLEAVEAMDVLQRVYREDDSEEVRRAAQSAGRELFKISVKNKASQ